MSRWTDTLTTAHRLVGLAQRGVRRVQRRHTDLDSPHAVAPDLIDLATVPVDEAIGRYFDLEIRDLHKLPHGATLVVGNHNSGCSFFELMGFCARARRDRPDAPPWHALAHDAIMDIPVVGPLLAQIGTMRASHQAAHDAFALGRKVVVCPGGNLEAFRPWSERAKIVFGGRKGWIRLALRHNVPITPVVFYGGHNAFFVLHDGKFIARATGLRRLLRVDTWPIYVGLPWGIAVGPWFHLPLPVRCTTVVLDPIPLPAHGEAAAQDEALVQQLYDHVTGVMQTALTALAQESESLPPRPLPRHL